MHVYSCAREQVTASILGHVSESFRLASQERERQGTKWLDLNIKKLDVELNKYRSLRKSLNKRANKQAEIRENTAQLINSAFARYAPDVSAA